MNTAARAESGLRGQQVSITGRLASMSRKEAMRRLELAGATYAIEPGEATNLLVVGNGGPPLGEDGLLTQSLCDARALQDAGAPLCIVQEEELLELLGLQDPREDLGRLYTTEQLSRILDVAPRQIRAWVRHGLIEPVQVVRRLSFFDFRQVATARALSRLTRSGVTPAVIRKSLEQLGLWLGRGAQSLAQLETLESSRLLVVRTEEGLAEPTGQLRLGFDDDDEPGEAPAGSRLRATPDWFELGAEAEEDERLEDAAVAYERAIERGGTAPEICFNLGNTYYSLERAADAVQSLLTAVELDPEYVEAWNNLGNIMAELGELDEAFACFRHALELEPTYADAHYNLAEILAEQGDYDEAREHWRAYLCNDPFSSWAEEVRERLRRTE
jgi:tetratricopeptide (TPR) repeat protein